MVFSQSLIYQFLSNAPNFVQVHSSLLQGVNDGTSTLMNYLNLVWQIQVQELVNLPGGGQK